MHVGGIAAVISENAGYEFGEDNVIVVGVKGGFPPYTIFIDCEGPDGMSVEADVFPWDWLEGGGGGVVVVVFGGGFDVDIGHYVIMWLSYPMTFDLYIQFQMLLW